MLHQVLKHTDILAALYSSYAWCRVSPNPATRWSNLSATRPQPQYSHHCSIITSSNASSLWGRYCISIHVHPLWNLKATPQLVRSDLFNNIHSLICPLNIVLSSKTQESTTLLVLNEAIISTCYDSKASCCHYQKSIITLGWMAHALLQLLVV